MGPLGGAPAVVERAASGLGQKGGAGGGGGTVGGAGGVRSGPCRFAAAGKVTGPVGRAGGGSQGARCGDGPEARGAPMPSSASDRGAGTTGSETAPSPAPAPGTPLPPTAPAAEAKRSSRESGTGAGPVSPVESSYNCPHQSSSGPVGLPPCWLMPSIVHRKGRMETGLGEKPAFHDPVNGTSSEP
ncbi:hypothetical protein GCM10010255_05060 [Streptomyces coeruleofuscus]|uniref:Uncharacterized protein n=1 Tax=Streptomyces coeruleofuscus TaxID=66879 RepID=A0ABN3HJV5_9ACTN